MKAVHKQLGGVVRAGDAVMRKPVTFFADRPGHQALSPMRGTVVYVHPRGRYHMVEFETAGGVLRECFAGVAE